MTLSGLSEKCVIYGVWFGGLGKKHYLCIYGKTHKTDIMAKNKHTTFRFDEQIKLDFKEECRLNSVDMTEVMEELMMSYSTISRNQRNKSKTE